MSAARTFAPVRRNSPYAGEREHLIWKPIGANRDAARKFVGALLSAAETFDDETKAAGKQMGALGLTGLKVLRAMTRLVDYRTGRLEPSIAYICEKTRLARATVVRALARLKEHGFLNWMRRSEPTDIEGAGPQVRQITNAYWFALKDEAFARVKRLLGATPPVAAAEPPPRPTPRRDSNKAMMQAHLQRMADDPEYQKTKAILAEQRARREASGASSISGQNPAEEQDG